MSPQHERGAVDLGEYRGRRALQAKRDADRQRKRDQAEQRTRQRQQAAPDAEHFGAVTPALLAVLGRTPTTVNRGSLIAVAVAHHTEMGAGDEHTTPMVDLAARLGIGRPTVRKATADLVAAGLLTRQNFPRRGPVETPAKYSRGELWPLRNATIQSKRKPLRNATIQSALERHDPDHSGTPRSRSRKEISKTPGDALAANGEPPDEAPEGAADEAPELAPEESARLIAGAREALKRA